MSRVTVPTNWPLALNLKVFPFDLYSFLAQIYLESTIRHWDDSFEGGEDLEGNRHVTLLKNMPWKREGLVHYQTLCRCGMILNLAR